MSGGRSPDDDEPIDPPHPREHAFEAEWRWGGTDSWKESARRTARYTQADWDEMNAENGVLYEAAVALLHQGKDPGCVEAKAIAELHRLSICRWFYECSPDMHAMLGEGYASDERFRAFYEDIAPGLADFFSQAVVANAKDRGASPERDDALAALKQRMGLVSAPRGGPLDVDALAGAERGRKRERKKDRHAAKRNRRDRR